MFDISHDVKCIFCILFTYKIDIVYLLPFNISCSDNFYLLIGTVMFPMRIKINPPRNNELRCCFCLHVRTATILLGIWHLVSRIHKNVKYFNTIPFADFAYIGVECLSNRNEKSSNG